nr:ribonuclease H-like domain-containing protein [Tanacetum cinerariifolium]
MTNYSLWEAILNGDSPIPTRVIEGVVQPVAPTTAEHRLVRKNELKARGTLLMALPNKHYLKLNIHKDAKTLMEAIEKRFGGNKETKKKLISQLEILRESLSQEDINLKFLRSLPTEWRTHTLIWRNKTDLEEQSLEDLFNSLKIYKVEPVSAVASVSAASAKILVSALPNVDTFSNTRTGRNLIENGPTSMGFDMSKVECYNFYRKGHFAGECSVMVWAAKNEAFRQKKNQPTMPSWYSSPQVLPVLIMRKSQFDVISYKTGLESVEARILVYQQNETVFEKDIKLLKLDVQIRDNVLIVLRQKFKKAEQERDELKLKLEKFQTSSKNLSQLLASQTNNKTGLGYDNQLFTSSMFDCDEIFSFESDVRTFMPPKPDLVFHDAPHVNETIHTAFHVELSPTKPDKVLSQSNRPSAPIINDWVSDSEDESEADPSHNVPSFVQTIKQVKTPRHSIKPVEHSIPAANHTTNILKPNSHRNISNRKACFICKSLTHLIKDCDYYEKKMAQTPARNHAQRGNHQHYAIMTHPNPQRHVILL